MMSWVVSAPRLLLSGSRRSPRSLFIILWAIACLPAQAQPSSLPPIQDVFPTSGESFPTLEPQAPAPPLEIPVESPAVPNESTPPATEDFPEPALGEDRITVQAFGFSGNTVFTDEQLSTALSAYLNRPLAQVELSRITGTITDLYITRGYVTSGAIIPEGRFENGILNIQVIEGRLETIEVLGTQRLAPSYVRDRITQSLSAPISRDSLLDSLRLLRLDPLIASVTAELSSGTQPGTSLLRVEVEEARTFGLQASLDNSRSPSVGSWQRRLQMQQLNLSGKGDRLDIGYSNSQGSNSIDANYSYPINAREGRLGLSFSHTGSGIIEDPFDVLDINSRSTSLELNYRQPLIRTPERELALGASLLHRRTRARFIEELDAPFPSPGSDDEGRTIVNELRFSQDYNQRSDRDFLGLRSQFAAGLPILGATTQDEAPDSTFLAWQGQAQYGRLLAPETLFLARSSVQLASRPLIPLAQFGIGGANTVRGYRQDVLLGDGGWFGSAEVRFPLLKAGQRQASQLQLVPFFDMGGVFNRGDRPAPDPSFIASLGLGLRFESGGDRRFSGRVEYGIPLVETAGDGDSLQARGLHASFQYRLF